MYEWSRRLRFEPIFNAVLGGDHGFYGSRFWYRLALTWHSLECGMKGALWLVCGIIFAFGLGISGMTQPEKVVGFLNVLGGWDPSLALVMVGAIGVHAVGYLFRKRMPKPVVADEFRIPSRNDVSWRLVLGAVLFGLGWGIAGYCPGPALVSLSSASISPYIFVLAMLFGMLLHHYMVPSEVRDADDSQGNA